MITGQDVFVLVMFVLWIIAASCWLYFLFGGKRKK